MGRIANITQSFYHHGITFRKLNTVPNRFWLEPDFSFKDEPFAGGQLTVWWLDQPNPQRDGSGVQDVRFSRTIGSDEEIEHLGKLNGRWIGETFEILKLETVQSHKAVSL